MMGIRVLGDPDIGRVHPLKNRSTTYWVLGLLAVLLVVAGCSSRGGIRGRVLLPGAQVGETATGDSSVTNAVVFLAGGERIEAQAPGGHSRMMQDEAGFRPHVLAITQGTEVQFANQGEVYHNAFSLSPVKNFDIGSYAPGDSRSVVFDQLGIVNVFCELHPASAGFVVVLPDHHFAQPDATGTFALPELPQGRYTVKAWHPIFGEISRQVDLFQSDDIDLKLEF
jgi:plastocyanin